MRKERLILVVVFILAAISATQAWQYYQWDQGFHKLNQGMDVEAVLKIMGAAPSYKYKQSAPIEPTWDGLAANHSLGVAVDVRCFAIPLCLKRWFVGFNKDGKLVSRWEAVLD